MRGVRRSLPAASGGAPQNTGVPSAPSAPQEIKLAYETAFQIVTRHPELLDPQKAAEPSRTLTDYLTSKVK